ncbi:MAG: alpha/beta hydrolase [Stenotrophobium sp.]
MNEAHLKLRVPAGVTLPGEGALQVAVEVLAPDAASLIQPLMVLVCLPGGGMNRRFYDLMPESTSDRSFSFARQMTARGFIVVLIDHLGIGESDRPQDGYALTPEVLMQANSHAVAQVLKGLRQGSLLPELPPLPELRSIGVGHSMGALMTILQQATHRQHAALAVLGFGTRGLPEFLKPEARELAADTAAVRAELVRLAKDMFGAVSYPRIGRSPRGNDLYGSSKADASGVGALKDAIEPLLPVPCFMSMLPGNVAPEAAQVDVPVFLGIGELDMVGPPHQVPASFTGSRDVTLHILPQTGHSHFLFPARTGLFDRLALWAKSAVGR